MPKNDHKYSKNGHFWILNFQFFFFQNWKTQFSNQIVINVIAFDPISIQTCLAPQNDRQNLSFVKDSYVLAQKMTRNSQKLAKRKNCQFFKGPVFNWLYFIDEGGSIGNIFDLIPIVIKQTKKLQTIVCFVQMRDKSNFSRFHRALQTIFCVSTTIFS